MLLTEEVYIQKKRGYIHGIISFDMLQLRGYESIAVGGTLLFTFTLLMLLSPFLSIEKGGESCSFRGRNYQTTVNKNCVLVEIVEVIIGSSATRER